jgi:hypothetical protein
VLLATGSVAACQTAPPNPTTFNFNRPTGVAQVCVRIETTSEGRLLTDQSGQYLSTPEPHALQDCANANIATPVATAGRFFAFRMFAVVTQSDRGELAVVNLHPTYNTGIVDNDPMIPGFTFIPVGSFPGAVAVEENGRAIYVANTGENTISVVDTRTILRSQIAGSGSVAGVIRLSGRPADVAVGHVESREILFVTMPETGELAYVDVTDPLNPGAPQTISLGARISGGLDGGIGGDGGAVDAGASDGGMGGSFRPERIAIARVDEAGSASLGAIDRIYVTDSRAAVVHTIQMASDGTPVEIEPLNAPTPTRPLTVTPTIFTTDPPRRFVYVGGADDGALSVLDTLTRAPVVVNASQSDPACQEGTSTFDANACHRLDAKVSLYTVPIKSSVISLATVTRDAMDPSNCLARVPAPAGALGPQMNNSSACDSNPNYSDESGPSVGAIRGVAVAAGLRDGTIRIVDVEDWQAYCSPDRRSSPALANPPAQRHLPRVAVAFPDPSNVSSFVSSPGFLVNGNLTQPGEPDPKLTMLTLPVSNGAIDELRVRDDTWSIVYQGAIPNLTLRVGAFQPDGDTGLHADVPGAGFCTRGALPTDIATLTDPSPCVQDPVDNDAGPRVLPDPALCDRGGGPDAGMTLCSQVFGTATAPCHRGLRVTHLTETSITVEPMDELTACSTMNPTGHELRELIMQCYPQAVLVSLRTGNGWTVSAANAGYVHTVTENPTTHECEDHEPNPGRLIENQRYDGPGFSALMTSGTMPSVRDSAYTFTISGGLSQLLVSGGAIPSSMIYSCPSRRLYMVDQAHASLVEYPVAPLTGASRGFN